MMKRITCTLLVLFLFAEATALAGVGSENTKYVGRTITTIKAGSEGKSSTADDKVLVFEHKTDKLTIPSPKINGLEYGQKVRRRVAMAILVSPIALFSKKRKHFLTVNYMDESDNQQADKAPGTSNARPSTNNTTGFFTERGLGNLFNAFAGCEQNAPCTKVLTTQEAIPEFIDWLTYSRWRAPGRQGNPDLNFDDFQFFHDNAFGNALAKLDSISDDAADAKIWTLPTDNNVPIVGRYSLKYSYNPKDKISDIQARAYEQRELQEKVQETISVRSFAAMLADQIDPDGTGTTKEKFISYMLRNQ